MQGKNPCQRLNELYHGTKYDIEVWNGGVCLLQMTDKILLFETGLLVCNLSNWCQHCFTASVCCWNWVSLVWTGFSLFEPDWVGLQLLHLYQCLDAVRTSSSLQGWDQSGWNLIGLYRTAYGWVSSVWTGFIWLELNWFGSSCFGPCEIRAIYRAGLVGVKLDVSGLNWTDMVIAALVLATFRLKLVSSGVSWITQTRPIALDLTSLVWQVTVWSGLNRINDLHAQIRLIRDEGMLLHKSDFADSSFCDKLTFKAIWSKTFSQLGTLLLKVCCHMCSCATVFYHRQGCQHFKRLNE